MDSIVAKNCKGGHCARYSVFIGKSHIRVVLTHPGAPGIVLICTRGLRFSIEPGLLHSLLSPVVLERRKGGNEEGNPFQARDFAKSLRDFTPTL